MVEALEARQVLSVDVHMIDVNTNPWPGSFPNSFMQFDDRLLFLATKDHQGTRLFTTDGTPFGTVPLRADTSLVSVTSNLLNIDGTLFFGGGTDNQAELWKTDGTEEGTVLVKEINHQLTFDGFSTYNSYPSSLTEVNGTLFFTADDGLIGRELWKSDGTEEGTVLVKNIHSEDSFPYASYPSNLTVANGTLFFTADDGIHGVELWKSDGTEAGTVMVKDIHPGVSEDGSAAYDSSPTYLTALGKTLIFAADDGSGGRELWRSDGTEAGTVRIKDIYPDAGGSNPSSLVVMGVALYFSADDSINGPELWRSDGTEGGTQLVRDINPGAAGSAPANLASFQGTLVFTADDGTRGRELWLSDGTPTGTSLVHDIRVGTESASPRALLISQDAFYFQADDGPEHGIEVWRSDGTDAGTMLVADFQVGPASSDPVPLYDHDGVIYASARVETYGTELWKVETAGGAPQLVKDITQGTWPSSFDRLTFGPPMIFRDQLFFSADTGPGAIDYELWKTDGTQAGTSMVKNINPSDRSTGSRIGSKPERPTIVGESLLFHANDAVHGHELWKTDGTETGTVLVKDIQPGAGSSISPYHLGHQPVVHQGELIFEANDGVHGSELWRSDGTDAGTVLIKDVNPQGNSSIQNFTRAGQQVFFTADDGAHGVELWTTDGTQAGTVMVIDIHPGTTPDPDGDLPNSSNPDGLIELDGKLLFVADDGTHGRELWISDGTAAGTRLLADIHPGSAGSSPDYLTNVSGQVFFTSDDGAHGAELWRTDGTSEGTFMVADVNPGAAGSSPARLVASGSYPVFYFAADDGTHGVELWRSDGTPEGTALIADINPGHAPSISPQPSFLPPNSIVLDGRLYFSADDGIHGNELWRTDGTAAGTEQVLDLITGRRGGYLNGLVAFRGALYFFGPADGLSELFRVDLISPSSLWGDLTNDGLVNVDDIEALSASARSGQYDPSFDLDSDGQVDQRDRRILVEEALGTWFGDANLDGQFDAHDLVLVLQRGHYGSGPRESLSWSDGDWNGDGRFDSDDLTLALQGDGYLRGPRV